MLDTIPFEKKEFHVHKEFSGLTRIFHWIRAFSIFLLIATGFYIAYPFLHAIGSYQVVTVGNPEIASNNVNAFVGYLNAYMRSFHIILGFCLIAISFFRVYLFFFDKESKPERTSFRQAISPKCWIDQIKAYLFIGKHPHIDGAYNPLQFATYFLLAILVLLISLSGIVLFYNSYDDGLGAVCKVLFMWFEKMCGGLSNVRNLHHILTWAFMIFIPIHIYMAVWNSIKYPNGGVDAIVSGMRYTDDVKV